VCRVPNRKWAQGATRERGAGQLQVNALDGLARAGDAVRVDGHTAKLPSAAVYQQTSGCTSKQE